MRGLLSTLVGSLTTLLLSALLAVMIWAYAVNEADATDRVFYTIPITYIQNPEQIVLGSLRETIQIDIEAPQSTLANLSVSNFEAEVDLREVPTGTSGREVVVTVDQDRVEILNISPETVEIELDRFVTRDVPVEIRTQGDAAPGFTIGERIVDPSVIQISGPEQTISTLSEVRATVFLDDSRDDIESSPRLTLYDQQDNIVSLVNSDLTLNPDAISVVIPVVEQDGVREKTVTPQWEGEPSEGYRLLSVNVEPSSVVVKGPPAVLDAITFLEAESIDVAGLNDSSTFIVPLVLPDGVTWEREAQSIVVSVEIEPILTSDVVTVEPELAALGEDLEAELSVDEVRVFLFGPLALLETVKDEVRVTLDLFGREPGTHIITPTVSVPVTSVEARSVIPAQITVQITETVEITDTVPITSPITATETTSDESYFETVPANADPLVETAAGKSAESFRYATPHHHYFIHERRAVRP